MYECTLPEILEMKQFVDVREAQKKAIDLDEEAERKKEEMFNEATR